MNSLIPLMLLLVLCISYVATQKQKTDKLVAILCVVVVLLFVCAMDMRETFANYCASKNDDHQLLDHVSISTPIGTDLALGQSSDSANFPTVDGDKDSARHMFMFARNKCNIGCCPSTYSCSGGCVCTTNKQRKFVNSRGGNKTQGGGNLD